MNSAKILAEQRAMRWSGIIRECRASGLSVAAFCKQAGVNTSRYYYWLKKLRDEACELFVLSRIGEEGAAVRTQGFARVEILDISSTVGLADAGSSGAGSLDVGSAGAGSSGAGSLDVGSSDACTAVSFHDSTQALMPEPFPDSTQALMSALPEPFSDDVTKSALKPPCEGQVNIETAGIKISADSTYPVAALAELLGRLVNDGAYEQRGGAR